MTAFTESVVEDAALGWLEGIGWQIAQELKAALATYTESGGTGRTRSTRWWESGVHPAD